jgi:uncharacterized membrane protein YhaH (DUF805 family)
LAGRASRAEFVWVELAAIGLAVIHLVVIDYWPEIRRDLAPHVVSGIISGLLFWVQIAVSVRRLHDLDKSGWVLVWSIVPVAGLIILIWLVVRSGTPGQNRFGPPASLRVVLAA